MNFTREPIIETVITPREGCKLVVRSSKGNGQEDYYVEAVEVVSFGHSFFFRSLEKPKSFLVPVSDYEILELREQRMALKNAPSERSLKIGGGRDAPRPPREQREQPREEPIEEPVAEGQPSEPLESQNARLDRKRDRRRRGRRGRGPDHRDQPSRPPHSEEVSQSAEGSELNEEQSPLASEGEEPKAAPSFISKLFPPPSTLIKETLGRYKTTESIEEESFPEAAEEKQKESLDESLFEHRFPSEESPDSDEDKFEE